MRALIAVALCGCSSISNPMLCDDPLNPCDSGSAGGTTGAGGGSGTAGGTAGSGGGSATAGGTSDGGCNGEVWSCGSWRTDGGTATRSCLETTGAGTSLCKPLTSGALPNLDYNYFRCRVQPILALSCAMIGCHGQEPARPMRIFARGRLRNHEILNEAWPPCLDNTPQTFDLYDRAAFTVQCRGNRSLTQIEWHANFDNARQEALGTTRPADSDLLVYPLIGSAQSHVNMKFWDTSSPEYATIATWLDGGALATCDAGYNDHI